MNSGKLRAVRCGWLVALALFLLGTQTTTAATIYATGGDGTQLATINTLTGVGTVIGPTGMPGSYAATFGPTGTLYGIANWATAGNRLVTFNLVTGAVTPVGGTFGVPFMLALEFGPNGTLYGGSWGTTNNFFSINPATGAPTLIGSSGFDGVMDFAFDVNGTLYAVNNFDLWTINTNTGVGTHVATLSGINGPVMGIMFDQNNNLFGTTYIANSTLYRINPITGVATPVGNTGLFAAHGGDIQVAAIPEPASMLIFAGLMATGAATYLVRRKQAIAG